MAQRVRLFEKGAKFVLNRSFSKEDVLNFAKLTGDFNKVHFEPSTLFSKPIVHGMLFSSQIPSLIAKNFPNCIYVGQTFKFKKPIYLDQQIQVEVIVESDRDLKKGLFYEFDTKIYNDEKEICMEGKASILIPDQQE